MAIEVRPVTAADLPKLADWIARPHWQDWWDDPDDEIAHIRDMVAGRDTTRPFFFGEAGETVPDPYFDGGFEAAIDLIEAGARGLLLDLAGKTALRQNT